MGREGWSTEGNQVGWHQVEAPGGEEPHRTPLADLVLSRCPVSVPASAGLALPWTVAVSPTFSSPRLPCRLSGPLVTVLSILTALPRGCAPFLIFPLPISLTHL